MYHLKYEFDKLFAVSKLISVILDYSMHFYKIKLNQSIN